MVEKQKVIGMCKKIFWCKNCLNMSTRPRITFDEKGWCNACQWSEEKKEFDWSKRKKKLENLLDKYRSNSGNFDSGLKLRVLTMPDRFLDQDKPNIQNDIAGLTAPHIVANILSALGREEEALALLEARSA